MNPKDKILSIDIGGSRIKATVLNFSGEQIADFEKIKTPASGKPEDVIDAIQELTKNFKPYDKISVGFPGYVKHGIVLTAPNLGSEVWSGIPFAELLTKKMNKPVRLLNDADMQSLGIADGHGFEIVVTLGTGFGTALLMDGRLLPHIELAHHPISKKKAYDDYVGREALKKIGVTHWNIHVQKIIGILKTVFHYDHLYIGGGNSKKITFELDRNITLVKNKDGIKGGSKLWQNKEHYGVDTRHTTK